ncbi:MAG TPA: hypothetical protein VIL49_03945 [Capillimicrobium sp.]|jgi:hypothetical protein
MRRALSVAVLACAVGALGRPAWAAQLIPVTGYPAAGPVLAPGAPVAWAARSGDGTQTIVLAPAGRAPQPLLSLPPSGGDLTWSVDALAVTPTAVGYAASLFDGVAARNVGDGNVGSAAATVTLDGTQNTLDTCTAAPGSGLAGAGIAVSPSATVVRSCATAGSGPATISVNGVGLATAGGPVGAAGELAAWQNGGAVTVYDVAAARVVGTVPVAGAWALAEDGTVMSVAPAGNGAAVVATPLQGAPVALATEARPITSLATAGGAVAYTTGTDVVVVRGGARTVVGTIRWFASPTTVSTDGERVAWTTTSCSGWSIVVASVGETGAGTPPCRIEVAPSGTLAAARATLSVAGPSPGTQAVLLTGRFRLRAGDRLLAKGTAQFAGAQPVSLPLTRAGRRVATQGRAVRGRVWVTVPGYPVVRTPVVLRPPH